jgi:3-oxoacyl-[acyl-carrier-protein] synthase III
MTVFERIGNWVKKNPNTKKIRIVGTGKYVPKKILMSDLEEQYGIPQGWSEKHSGVISKHWITHESVAFMGAEALKMALINSNLVLSDIDLIISAGSSYDYPVPHQAPLIKKELNIEGVTIPAISINSTCLSFVTALDIASSLLDNHRYKRIAIVSSETSSKNLNPKDFETFTLFGDGAAAAIVEYSTTDSHLLTADMITIESEAENTIVRGGGAVFHSKIYKWDDELYSFKMNGKALIKITTETIRPFLQNLLQQAKISPSNIDWIVPHQASKLGLLLFKRLYPHLAEKTISNLETHGNCISASIPMALHDAITAGKIKRGNVVLLVGTSAGFSIGGLILKY